MTRRTPSVRPILSSGRVILKEDCIGLIKQRRDESPVQESSLKVYDRNKLVATETDMRRATLSFASAITWHFFWELWYFTSTVFTHAIKHLANQKDRGISGSL